MQQAQLQQVSSVNNVPGVTGVGSVGTGVANVGSVGVPTVTAEAMKQQPSPTTPRLSPQVQAAVCISFAFNVNGRGVGSMGSVGTGVAKVG